MFRDQSFNVYRILRNLNFLVLSLSLILLANCGSKELEMEECDSVGNAYGGGKHFIDRTLVKEDENGIVDYSTIDTKKLLERSRKENSKCFPGKKDSL